MDVNLINENDSKLYEDMRVVYVKIGNKSKQFIKNLLNGYCDIKTFDFVMFTSSLVANKQFMESFKHCPYINIWKNIWRREDYDELYSKLSTVTTNCFDTIFDIVKDYYFREDALEYTMSKL
jgi:hypothetical protein